MRVGIFDPYLDSLGGGERYTLTLAEYLSQNHRVEIFWNDQTIKEKAREILSINLDQVNFVNNIFTREIKLPERLIKTSQYDLIFYLSDGSLPISLAKKTILHFQTPFIRVNGKTLINRLKLSRICSVICNSYFTKKYIDQTYGVSSVVVYPPVDVAAFKPLQKNNLILTVGRFTSYGESKKQEIMVSVFKKMFRQGLNNWKLVLAGGLMQADKGYFEKINQAASGFPIELLPNISFKELKTLYGKAKIYWHANGFGEDERRNPELFEHFGISIVEAMAAGSVPVVYNGGGVKEIITSESGYLWSKEEELMNKTLGLLDDVNELNNRSVAAQKRAAYFSKENFLRKFDEIIFS